MPHEFVGPARSALRALKAAGITAITTFTLAGGLAAQDVGYVSDVRHSGELHDCRSRPGAKPRADDFTIRGRQGVVRSAALGDTRLTIGDTLSVKRTADVRLQIQSADYGRGAIFLAPQLLACSRLFRDTLAATEGGANAGYRIVSDTRARRSLVFRIDSGAAYIQWDNTPLRRLIVVAGSTTLHVDGTSLGVYVHPGGRAETFVRNGTVRVGTTLLQLNRMYDLVPRQAPQPRPQFSQDAASALARDVAYHTETVYQPPVATRPWYKHPAFIVGSVAVVAGATVALWPDPASGRPRRGSIRVRIPL